MSLSILKPRAPRSRSSFLFAGSCLLGIALALGGCTTSRQTRGYIFNEEVIQNIAPGVDNRASVQQTLGTPSTTSAFGDEVWYYISRSTVVKGFLEERAEAQNVLAIHFDDGGMVSEIDRYDMADAQKITPRDDKTPIRGKTLGFFQQLLQGIGRVAPGGPNGPGGTGGPGRGPGR
ncbi:MAG: outer membrane protein assembly factor BamE [Alphaproteobacteria bacterium]|nr:MAG: outer membrane protein assembly factor BamE [Alphaproteobacteria bacterium]